MWRSGAIKFPTFDQIALAFEFYWSLFYFFDRKKKYRIHVAEIMIFYSAFWKQVCWFFFFPLLNIFWMRRRIGVFGVFGRWSQMASKYLWRLYFVSLSHINRHMSVRVKWLILFRFISPFLNCDARKVFQWPQSKAVNQMMVVSSSYEPVVNI